MVAVIDNCAIILAGQGHVFGRLVFAMWRAKGTSHTGCVIEMKLRNEFRIHFISDMAEIAFMMASDS